MRILTAFTNSLGGRDSYHLGVSLAEAFSCPLDLVTVVKGGGGCYVLDVTDHAFQDVVATQVDDWMSEIMEEHRPRVPVSKYLRYSLSFPEGIIASAEELKADLLVAGGGRHGVLGRVSLGSVGQTLLNSSTVPVALSPRGMRHAPLDSLSRITVMLGESGRWRGVLSKARTFADRAGVPLRLVTVATGDSQDTAEIEKRTESLLAEVRLDLTGLDDQRVQIVHAHSMSAAVLAMEWSRNELAFLGSARLAQSGRLFLGPDANKILRVLPVPLVAVPADPADVGGGT